MLEKPPRAASLTAIPARVLAQRMGLELGSLQFEIIQQQAVLAC